METGTKRVLGLLGAGGRDNALLDNAGMVFGAAAVATSASIHLHLWLDGYSVINIGPLFLAQAVTGFVLAALLIWSRRLWTAALGAGYLLATAGGFLVSVNAGFLGFRDTWSAADARVAFWDEIAGAVLLLTTGGLVGAKQLLGLRQATGPRAFAEKRS